jgi:serine/threonine protein kinase
MATGSAPWSGVDSVFAAVHLIGYTDAVPETPKRMSAEGKDFLDKCLRRRADERWTAEQLLEHPFLASAGCGADVDAKWVSPKRTLDVAMWESDADEDDDIVPDLTADERMKALAAPYSLLPDWDNDDGWVNVLSGQSELPKGEAAETPAVWSSNEDSPAAALAGESTSDGCSWDDEGLEEEIGVEDGLVTGAAVPVAAAPSVEAACDYDTCSWDEGLLLVEAAEMGAEALDAGAGVGDELALQNVGVADNQDSVNQQLVDVYSDPISDPTVVADSESMPDFLYLYFSSTLLLRFYFKVQTETTNLNISSENHMNSTRCKAERQPPTCSCTVFRNWWSETWS